MNAQDTSFKDLLLKEEEIRVPFFQRAYVWEKEHWEKLFEELNYSEKDKEPFFGSIVFKRSQKCDNYIKLIDGQQRITTFSILLKAIIDQINIDELNANQSDDEKKSLNIFKFCIYSKTLENKPLIKHSHIDEKEYKKILKDNLSKENTKNLEENRITNCYLFFKEKIERYFKTNKEKYEFADKIIKLKSFVGVSLEGNEDEQKIFDAINSTGEKLTATDIIKNSLFDKIIKESDENEAIQLYDEYWKNIFEKDEDELNFWNVEIKTGSESRTRSEILFHTIAILKGIFTETDNLSKLSDIYKNHIKDKNKNELENLLKDIKKYSEIYHKLPEISSDTLIDYDDEIRFFHILQFCNIKTPFLPIIFILKDKFKDTSNFKKCLQLIEIFVFFRNLNEKRSSSYNKMVMKIIKELNGYEQNIYEILKNNLLAEIPKKDEIKNILYEIDNKKAKIILFWIELFRENKVKSYKDKTIGLNFVYQLEHIMPQTWEENWSDIINNNEEKAYELIYQIGNMTLLKGSLNATLSNLSWDRKKNGDNGKYKYHISNNADLIINKELLDKEIWNETEITKRSENLIKEFFEIWNYDNL